jgi:hypothetical protein
LLAYTWSIDADQSKQAPRRARGFWPLAMSSEEGRLVRAPFVNLLAHLWQRPEIVSLHVQNYAAAQEHKRILRDFHGSLTETQNCRRPDPQAIGLPVFI